MNKTSNLKGSMLDTCRNCTRRSTELFFVDEGHSGRMSVPEPTMSRISRLAISRLAVSRLASHY